MLAPLAIQPSDIGISLPEGPLQDPVGGEFAPVDVVVAAAAVLEANSNYQLP